MPKRAILHDVRMTLPLPIVLEVHCKTLDKTAQYPSCKFKISDTQISRKNSKNLAEHENVLLTDSELLNVTTLYIAGFIQTPRRMAGVFLTYRQRER